MLIERISLLKVPVDIIQPENMEEAIRNLLKKPGTKQIIFLSVWDLLKARRNNKFGECVKNADLVLPISKSLIKGATFLKLHVPVRYNPFSSIISFLSVLDSYHKSLYMFNTETQTFQQAEKNIHETFPSTLYLLGGKKKTLTQVERNLHITFPNIRIIGRYVGYYPKNVEPNIISAIYKASPALVLVSDGIPEKNSWAFNRRNKFKSSTFVYHNDIFNIFSKRSKHISNKTFDKGLEIWPEIIHNPLKIFYIFPFFWYKLLLLWFRITKKS